MLFRRIVRELSKGTYVAGMAVTLSLSAVIFYNVILRYIFNRPTFWAEEVSSIMLVMIAFLALAELSRRRSHIKFNIVLDRLSPRKHAIAEVITSVAGLIFCAALIWQGGMATHMVYTKNMCMPSLLRTPLFIPYLFLPLGALMLSLQLLVRIAEDLKHLRGEQ